MTKIQTCFGDSLCRLYELKTYKTLRREKKQNDTLFDVIYDSAYYDDVRVIT